MSEAGSPRTHKRKRQLLRRQLRERGATEADIDRAVERLRQRQEASRRADIPLRDFDDLIDIWWDENRPQDAGYRPNPGDALLRGAARVTGATARAIRRPRAVTRHEYDQQEHRDSSTPADAASPDP